ncbi:putative U-box domain-containing protein 50 [Lycium ferocissimum]|uniref:putative U-box domain-containing protein 50 n=1 Tax=Lycium ferocissimum TaxID=112874 RepID=UPI002815FB3D|nr:putative U-box domain-containing protein 50 [Lycium ferocissimum]
MAIEMELENKVYVAVSSDIHDGFLTLQWALKRWSSNSITIVILYASNNICKDYVITPMGKLPAGSVNDEKLKDLEKFEEAKDQKILWRYKVFCGNVKVEAIKIERYDESIQNFMVDLISGLRITKLVMSLTFMKPSSWKSGSAISGSFFVHRQKPEFCELYVICGGKLVFLREGNNEGLIEDDQGIMVAKSRTMRQSFRDLVVKMFPEHSQKMKNQCDSSSSSASNDSFDQWEKYKEEIENYMGQLLPSNVEEVDDFVADETLQKNITELVMAENMTMQEKKEALRIKFLEIKEAIQLSREELNAHVEGQAKAQWAITLCTRRAEEIDGRINDEIARKADLKRDLDATKDELSELHTEVEVTKSKLSSILELQHELSNKMQISSLARSRAEVHLEKILKQRTDTLQEIEEFRKQRTILRRRIEFCREKDAIGNATMLIEPSFKYKEFSAAEIRAATDGFSDRMRLKSGGDWTDVYKAKLHHTSVAIKLYSAADVDSEDTFNAKVKLLSHMRHPHILSMIGYCSELRCIVFEYMHNGCLRDILFSGKRGSKRRNKGLKWQARICIVANVCTGLCFLHRAKPRPVAHGNLNPSKILLDSNNVAKIHGIRTPFSFDKSDIRSDIRAYGNLVLQILTGRNWAGLIEEAIMMDQTKLIEVLDPMAGEWPLDIALELGRIGIKCLSIHEDKELNMTNLARELDKVKKLADEIVANGESGEAKNGRHLNEIDSAEFPNFFLCPIFQEVMKNPHVAADGFSYELEAIEEWLKTGRDTSPMTNLKLKDNLLTPNHSLRALIQDSQKKRSISTR